MLHTLSVEIVLLVFFTIYVLDGQLGHVTRIIINNFHFHVLRSLHKKFS